MSLCRWINQAGLILAAALVMNVNHVVLAADSDMEAASNKIEKIDFATLPGGKVSVKLVLTTPLNNPPAGFSLSNPSRIALDFPGTTNGLDKSAITVNQGILKSVGLAEAKGRTRLVLNLVKNAGYNATMAGNEVSIVLQESEVSTNANTSSVTRFAESQVTDKAHSVKNVDFARGKNGEARVIVDLSDATTGIDIKQKGKNIVVDFVNADIAAALERRLNVTSFNTPVLTVDTMRVGKNVRMVIEPQGKWEQSSYQADKRFILDVKPLVEDPNKLVQGSKPGYNGEKLSLNFQNIEVRAVLQVIADFTGFNIITSDTVTGNLTLRLKDVPWDQALDIIMQSKGLSQRKTGNVIWVAPAEELAAKEKALLEASQQIEDLEPIRTEVFTLKYQKADALKNILSDSKQKILSKRGSAVIDPRTNTLFVQDTAKHLQEVQDIINKTDIAVRQVLIESRIVIADSSLQKRLGSKFGYQKKGGSVSSTGTLSGAHNLENTGNIGGTATTTTVDETKELSVNLPASGSGLGTFAFSFLKLPWGLVLDLEISASEADSKSKVISSPRVVTANQQKATIDSGVEIPYQQSSSSGATNVSFKKATLTLEVTPSITPDDKISMELDIHKDSVGDIFNGVPSINTRKVNTQVMVDNGETAVLGGVYEESKTDKLDKVPFMGDIPVLGNLFKRTTKDSSKSELLIFITPKIIQDSLNP